MKAQDRPTEPSENRMVDRILISLVAFGILGLVALVSFSVLNPAFAQEEGEEGEPPSGPGFKPGSRAFSNPFAPQNRGEEETMFQGDEEEEFSEDFESNFNQANQGGDDQSAPRPARAARGGVSVGGGTAGGVIQGNEVAPIRVNDETAEGSREVVTDFNFPDADIMDIAKALGKLTGKNFILDKDVKGRITIISNSPITVGDAWKAFLTALDINGFAIIPSGNFIRIARQRDARDKQLKTFVGDYSPDTDALITRVFPLKYLSADEVARNFRSFMPANSRIIPYEQTNTVIVTDTGANIQKLSKLLEILDVEGYDAGIEVIPVKYASAVELSKLIDTLVPGAAVGGGPGGAGAPRFGGAKFTARRTKEGGVINTIIADERTNTLIVHANTKGADEVRELVAKLDQRLPAVTGGGRVHVIYLQFADAESTANTLNNIVTQTTSGRPASGQSGGTGVNPTQASLFEGSIKVAADKSTNALVVTASPQDFITVQRVVNKLDIPRDQVYAEVVIMEITLDRKFDFSSNMAAPMIGASAITNPSELAGFLSSQGATSQGAVFGFNRGKEVITLPGPNNQTIKINSMLGLIKAIQENSFGNVLATPQILTLDNTEAMFESAETIPFVNQTAIQGVGLQSSVNRERISLSITIKPQINKLSNFVKLDVKTKIAELSSRPLPQAVQSIAVGTQERVANTSVVVSDGDTVVFGGLMRDNTTETTTKVPLLGDIPVLGWLFRSKSTRSVKSNLLVFITPKIIRQYEKIRAILDQKLKDRDNFLEEHAGGKDPVRKQRDRMIRGLPDVADLNQPNPNRFQTIGDEDTKDKAAVPVDSEEDPINMKPRSQGTKDEAGAPVPETAPPSAPNGPDGSSDDGFGEAMPGLPPAPPPVPEEGEGE